MAETFRDQRIFHLTGRRSGDGLAAFEAQSLRPAMLAGYRDLTRLRYDYPLVLLERGGTDGFAASLTVLVNRLLRTLAPRGGEGERLRRHVLRLERELRAMLAAGAEGGLSDLWVAAANKLRRAEDDSATEILVHAGESLGGDGPLVDCDGRGAGRFMVHAWRYVQAQKAARFQQRLDTLQRELSDILRAAFVHSQAGCQPEALRAAVGALHANDFDFAAMARLVGRNAPQDELSPSRRRRIEWALSVLGAQRFLASRTRPAGPPGAHDFLFDDVAAAVAAYRERLPQVLELLKAIAIADLEARNSYREADHGPLLESYDRHALTADDLALFPDYLVCIPAGHNDAPENAGLMDALSSGLPIKVVVEVTELLDDAAPGTGHFAFGIRNARLATTAMGLGGMFVLQAPCSNLYRMRDRVERGMGCRSPALFCIYTGARAAAGELPSYLTAAAAMEARAFPAFVYDAAAGENWAGRFSLASNPDPDADWPVQPFDYADAALQRIRDHVAFTAADFALCDARHAGHFAVVPRERWSSLMIPAADWLALPEPEAAEHVPYLLAVDASNVLYRVVADAWVMQAARRCLLLWRRLQEQGGIHDAHAEGLLAREKAAWEMRKNEEIEALHKTLASGAAGGATPAAAAVTATAPAVVPPEKARSDEPWIETARCPSCNECQLINPQMFGYDQNRQAYIKDPGAGTFRQLVEAAEACQVAIIHPGKPRNPNEPGLDELLKRAEPFQ